jgi:hypothetical protein
MRRCQNASSRVLLEYSVELLVNSRLLVSSDTDLERGKKKNSNKEKKHHLKSCILSTKLLTVSNIQSLAKTCTRGLTSSVQWIKVFFKKIIPYKKYII